MYSYQYQEFIRRLATPSNAKSTTTIVAKTRPSSSRTSVAKAKGTSKVVASETSPAHWQCPECSQEFVFTFQKTMAASIANHLKKHKPKDQKATAKKKTKTTKKRATSSKSSSRLDTKEPKKKAFVVEGEPIKKKRGRPRKLTVTFSEEEPAKKRRKKQQSVTALQAVTPSRFTMSKRSTPARSSATMATNYYVTPTPPKKESHHLLPNVSPIVVESTSSVKKEDKTVCFSQSVHVMATDATKALRWNNHGDATLKDEKTSTFSEKETTKARGEHECTFCSFDNIESSPFGKENAENDRENILPAQSDVGIPPLEQVQEDVSAELSSFQYSPIKMGKQVKSSDILQHPKSSQGTSAFASTASSNSCDVYPCDGQGAWAQRVLMSKPSAEVMQPLFSPLKLPAVFKDLPFPHPIMHIPSNEHDIYQFLEEIGDDLFDFD